MEGVQRALTPTQQRQPQRLLENVDDWTGQMGDRMGSETGPETHGLDTDSGITTDD